MLCRPRRFHRTLKKTERRTHVVTNVVTAEPQARPAERASKEGARPVLSFTAIPAQEEMKLCSILNPKIGVIIMGDRATGKFTTVRTLVDLLPEIQIVSGDPVDSDAEDPEIMSQDVWRSDGYVELLTLRRLLLVGMKALNLVLRLKRTGNQVRAELDVDDLVGDIVTIRAAKSLAASRHRDEVTPQDILSHNCLRHRLRKDRLESIDSDLLVVETFSEMFGLMSLQNSQVYYFLWPSFVEETPLMLSS